jgi:hypothetical protein
VWRGRADDAGHPLHLLHEKIYGRHVKHAGGNVYYALVCRVAMGGSTAVTQDGIVDSRSGKLLWTDPSRTRLANGTHALVVETGGRVERFREFVVFDPSAISIAFLSRLGESAVAASAVSQRWNGPSSKRRRTKAVISSFAMRETVPAQRPSRVGSCSCFPCACAA